ncbi:MAG: sigma factor [Planctomycetota bacterium]
MPRLQSAVKSNVVKRSPNDTLWASYLKNPSERRHEALWATYQPLVRHSAERFNDKMNHTFDVSSLIAAGNVGLLDAIAEFSGQTTAPFETLAVPMIRQAMARSLTVERFKAKEHVLRMELAEAITQADDPRAPTLKQTQALLILNAAKIVAKQ